MYERAERSINEGLSLGARIVIALFAALFGIVMIAIASPESGAKAVFFYGFGAFCLMIAVACIAKDRVRQFVGSVIGSAIFLAGVAYLVAEVREGVFWSPHRGDPSAYKAILYMLFIGLPGASYAYRTRFGFRKAP